MLNDIERNLRALELDFAAIQREYPGQVKEAATAKINYEIAVAEAFDTIKHEMVAAGEKPTAAGIEPLALLRVRELYAAHRTSEAIVDGQKKKIDVMQSILMSTQSRVKIAMVERGLTNFQT